MTTLASRTLPIAAAGLDRIAPAAEPALARPWSEPRAAVPAWAAALFDAVDYGLLLLGPAQQVLHANRAACALLHQHPAGRCWRDALEAEAPDGLAALAQAIDSALARGWRRLVTLRFGGALMGVAVVPLPPGGGAELLLVLSRARVCEPLSVHWFARSHGLTSAEGRVLDELCAGATPTEIAERLGVALSTVRTQLATIRAKTGAASLRALVVGVACLPPIVCAVACRLPADAG